MKILLRRIGTIQIATLLLLGLPLLALSGAGLFWLWQSGYLLYWLMGMVISGALVYALQRWSVQRSRRILNELFTEPDPNWSPRAAEVWQKVEALADACDPADWSLDNSEWIVELGRQTLDTVSRCYFPSAKRPLLELTVPHTLLIIEQACRDLRKDITENIPFSDRLTMGDLLRVKHWKSKADQAYNLYRAGRMIVSPASAVFSEFWRHFRERSFSLAYSEFQRWFLRAYVRKIGYYAIDLYSGRQPPLSSESPSSAPTASPSDTDLEQAAQAAMLQEEEPLRILILGRTNSGKSSLINALYGKLLTATDILPNTTRMLTPFLLIRDGFTRALIFDSPGYDSLHFDQKSILEASLKADLILWVSPANRPDRQSERQLLDQLRASLAARLQRRPPPLLVAVSHIDLLRPVGEWQPPYDLTDQYNIKAGNIRAAVEAVAHDLAIPPEHVTPVCLKEGNIYNVSDTFWSAILTLQDSALQIRLLRCLEADKRANDWALLRRQLMNAGRFLWKLPDKIKG